VIGNGGSAAIANHWATDFAKGIATSTTIKPKVRSLVCNESLLTAEANDNGYDSVFANQLRTWGKYRDVLVCISSSGNSPNIKEAVDVALSHGLFVIGISGFEKGNYLDRTANIGIHVDASNYGIIEDVSSNIMHCLSQSLRKHFAVPGIDTRSFTF
jgi:phosphoheptose isomerase